VVLRTSINYGKTKSQINVPGVPRFEVTLCETISPSRRSWLPVVCSDHIALNAGATLWSPLPEESWGGVLGGWEGLMEGLQPYSSAGTVRAAPAPLLRALLAHGAHYLLSELLLPVHKQICFCLKTFPHESLPSSEDCSLRLILNFLEQEMRLYNKFI